MRVAFLLVRPRPASSPDAIAGALAGPLGRVRVWWAVLTTVLVGWPRPAERPGR